MRITKLISYKKLYLLLILFFANPCSLHSADIQVGKFSSKAMDGWERKSFKGETYYTLTEENDRTVLKAESKHAASGLIRKLKINTKKYPLLRWAWKVEHTLKREDITSKTGDDFAARVYVVFPQTFFWQTRAINYVWASKIPKGTHAPSPYTSNTIILSVESGDNKVGQWINEERNIYEDYVRIFGEKPPTLGAIAIMSDTDDTNDEVTAWYGDIRLSNE